jgi:excisionase family DNA binding protein
MGLLEPPVDGVMNYRGLSAYLKIAQGTLRHWVMREEIPYFKIGQSVRFSKKDIDAWLEVNKREAKGKQAGETADTIGELFATAGGAQQCARTGEGVDEENVTRRAPDKCNTKKNDARGEA